VVERPAAIDVVEIPPVTWVDELAAPRALHGRCVIAAGRPPGFAPLCVTPSLRVRTASAWFDEYSGTSLRPPASSFLDPGARRPSCKLNATTP
jgi:hypothetical protein